MEISANVGGVLIAQVAVLFQRLINDLLQSGREIGIQAQGWNRRTVKDRFEDDRRGIATERQRAGRHFVQHRPKRKQVGAGIEFFALGLLRRHIRDRPDRGPWAGQVLHTHGCGFCNHSGYLCLACHGRKLGEPEVENLGAPALGDEDVRRLDVAVHDAFGMRCIECVGYLDCQTEQHICL